MYKYAARQDGRIAAADSTRQWITSAESRVEVHALLRELVDVSRSGPDVRLVARPKR